MAAFGILFLAACIPPVDRGPAQPVLLTASPSDPTEAVTSMPNSTANPDDNPALAELDLRYANVTQVTFERLAEGEYRFAVTLYHDDDGEAPNSANAWQVEDLQGNLLGRRELLHSHGTQPFTRSHTITIPAGVELVLVRGHDMTHGFGGQGMKVDLNSGQTTPVDLAPDP